MKPGDIIFWEATYYNPNVKQQKHLITHVEIYIGPEDQTIGARWQTGVVQLFDTYKFVSKSYDTHRYYYRSLDPWLRGECVSHCKEHPWARMDNIKKSKNSIFQIGEEDFVADAEELYEENKLKAEELLSKDKFYVSTDSPVQNYLDDMGYTKVTYSDLTKLKDKNNIIIWSQN